MSTEALLLSCIIDAEEKRDVAACDVPGAFMQANIDETIYIRMDGELARLLEKIDPSKYSKHLTHKDGKPVIYLHRNKALYGTLQAALMFCKELSGTLLGWGFELNPYD